MKMIIWKNIQEYVVKMTMLNNLVNNIKTNNVVFSTMVCNAVKMNNVNQENVFNTLMEKISIINIWLNFVAMIMKIM